MSTETFYVLRDDDGWYLWSGPPIRQSEVEGDVVFNPEFGYPIDIADRMTRSDAEDTKAVFGGTVQRVAVTTEDVGLRWVDHQRGCPGPCRHWKLMDGDDFMGTINTDAGGEGWFVFLGLGGVQTDGPFPTLEDAKAAAEAAVRETWT